MQSLFSTSEENLEQLFETLPEEDVQELCSSQVYCRATEYFDNGYVSSAEFNTDKTRLTAKVKSSGIYTVQVHLRNGTIHVSCTCPQDILCKHVVAVMLYAVQMDVDTEPGIAKSNHGIKMYLDSLSKEELVGLVMKYAPAEFYTAISNKHSDASEAQKTFNKAKHNIQDTFSTKELLYDPHAFEESLIKIIRKLSGLEKQMSGKLSELILYIIEEVEKATDEGHLYDHYSDYNFEPSEEFYTFMTNCIRAMEFSEKIEFLEELDCKISNSSYSTFSGAYKWMEKCFADRDLPDLKALLVNEYGNLPEAIVESYYSRVSAILSDEEKETVLTVLINRDSARAVELAELLGTTGKRRKSIIMLKRLIYGNSNGFVDGNICALYLDQLKAEKLELGEAAMKCLNQCPDERMLQKVVELLPAKSAASEQILEKKNPGDLLNYLENSKRITDALELVKRNSGLWHDRVFSFYKGNKKAFPHEAEKYFRKIINENLEGTGDHYYHTIADALKHLKQINTASADELTLHLRQNYRRRSKLMAMIEDI